jgi:CBS domain-containing protein
MPLGDVARVLVEHDLRGVPVVDEGGQIIGLVDEHDVSKAYVGSDTAARVAQQIQTIDLPHG